MDEEDEERGREDKQQLDEAHHAHVGQEGGGHGAEAGGGRGEVELKREGRLD